MAVSFTPACGLLRQELGGAPQPAATPVVQAQTTATPTPTGGTSTLSSINRLKSPQPSSLCGKAGWSYLVSEYFGPNCASCHSAGGFAPSHFTDANPDNAYSEATKIAISVLLQKSTKNDFCGPACNLSIDGDVYKAILAWTTEETCP